MPLAIKICGLKTPEAVAAALDGGASHVGFIFFPPSPRHIVPNEAAKLREKISTRAQVVAVTVDADDAMLAEIVRAAEPDILQLHGKEPPERVAELKSRWGLPAIKAFSVRETADLAAAAAYEGVADFFLFDAKPPLGAKLPGGNGVAFDWRILADFACRTPWFLSGGLHAGNVAEALRVAKPAGIDASSGVERAPGEKDAGLIRSFLRTAQAEAGAALAA